jgi:hypothetical protein
MDASLTGDAGDAARTDGPVTLDDRRWYEARRAHRCRRSARTRHRTEPTTDTRIAAGMCRHVAAWDVPSEAAQLGCPSRLLR